MSDTPIYDALWLEQGWWDRPGRFMTGLDPRFDADWFKRERLGEWRSEPETVSVEIVPDTTKFQDALRVGGRRAGRSAQWDRLVQQTIQWQAERNAEHVRMMSLYSGKSIRECLSMWPTPEWEKPQPAYSPETHELSRNTGWSLEESEDMIQRVAIWAKDAITNENVKALGRTMARKDKQYPTSSPSWARKRSR